LVEKVVKLIGDGMWHSFSEIMDKMNLQEDQFRKVVEFLRDFNLADVDTKQERLRISVSFLELPV
jgi:hypothetical protein